MTLNAFALMKSWQLLELEGPDSRDFLNRLTSANFKQLQPSTFTPGALLAPTGKLNLYFKALLTAENHYLLLVPKSAQEAYDIFEKLHFREKLTLKPRSGEWSYLRAVVSDAACAEKLWAGLGGVPLERGQLFETPDGLIALNEGHWATPPVTLDLGVVAPRAKLSLARDVLTASGCSELPDLEVFRLRAADPAAPWELNENTIPLEAKLDDAVHEGKGCYPGQEVIERIRSMGQPPRLLVSLRGQGPAPAKTGEAEIGILSEGHAVGTVTSLADDPVDGGWVGLGYVKRTLVKPDAAFTVASQPVSLRFK